MKPRRTGKIDWQDVRKRLARAIAATEEARSLSPERARAVLEERARLLARVPAPAVAATEVLLVTTFALAGEHYAIETGHVREVVRAAEFTPVTGAPAFLVGLLNLRGEILAVLDLRGFLGVAAGAWTEHSRVLVLGGERAEFGIVADGAEEVTTLRRDEVFEPPASVAGVGREYMKGVTKDALIVLDGTVLLQDARLFIDQGEESGA
jgi:purine-binding chemotaxis protein CheW